METYVYDIECFPNLFVVIVYDVKEKRSFHFEIGPDQNDLKALIAFFYNRPFFLVSFNGHFYDDAIMSHLWKEINAYRNLSAGEICEDLFNTSDKLIRDFISPYDLKKHCAGKKWITIDLQRYWTKLVIKSKHISLKACENLIRAENLKDLPYAPGTVLDKTQRSELISYGYNDVKETYNLYVAMRKEIQLRVDAGKIFFKDSEYHRNKILSLDSVNMGVEIMMYELEKLTGITKTGAKMNTRFTFAPVPFKDLVHPDLGFKTPVMEEMFWIVKMQAHDPTAKDFKYDFYYNGKTYTIGLGGIHTKDDSRVFRKGRKRYFSIDAESYYPHLIKRLNIYPPQLTESWLDLYWDKFLLRKTHKKLAKTTRDPVSITLNDTLKLLINGASGNLKSPFSPLYHPTGNIQMTLNGQLFLLKLIEMMKLAGIYTESVNTDGILVEIEDDQYETMLGVAKEWETLLDIPLEIKEYDLIVRHSVNKYFARNANNGEIEDKGNYITEPSINFFHSREGMVVRKAFREYFINNTLPEDYIYAEMDPLEFTYCPRSEKKFTIIYKGLPQQRINRIAYGLRDRGAAYIYRQHRGVQHSLPGFKNVPVVILNHVPEGSVPEDYHIDRNRYVNETYKWIAEVQPLQQKLFAL